MSLVSMCSLCPHGISKTNWIFSNFQTICFYYFEDWADLVSPYRREDCGKYILIEDGQLLFPFMEQYI